MDQHNVDPAALAAVLAHLKLAVAALCGGIVRLLFRPAASLAKAAWLLFGCVTCGFYGTPPVVAFWKLPETFAGAIGALLGLVGLTFAERILKAVDGLDLGAILLRWLEKKG